jgi:phosphoribosylanthranilate isomerase
LSLVKRRRIGGRDALLDFRGRGVHKARPMGLLVKICGITSADAADAAVRAGADLAGLMFHARSPRNLLPEQAAALASRLRGRLKLAVVLSDPTDEAVATAIAAVKPDFIQLHGSETFERLTAVRSKFGIAIIKAIAVAEADDLADVARFEDCADMLLFDAKPPAGASREGGHGEAFDWQLLRGRKIRRPWLLAGGLNPKNVVSAIRSSEAPGVDVSSGVEDSLAHKNVDLIVQFVANARSAEFAQEARR